MNPEQIMHDAREIIEYEHPELAHDFLEIVSFVIDNPALAMRYPGARPPEFGDYRYLERMADRYINGVTPHAVPYSKTVSDAALPVVMEHLYGVPVEEIPKMIEGHRIAMVGENLIGELLERYIDEALGEWIWCAGEVVRATDFIRRGPSDWEALQIKNRDNSENSSSSKIREGTSIQKWYRTVSRTGRTRWEQFPVDDAAQRMSELNFHEFIAEYKKVISRL